MAITLYHKKGIIMRKELQVALQAAQSAGQLQMHMQLPSMNRIRKGGSDFATLADVHSQRFITELLQRRFPHIPIVAEEDEPKILAEGQFWIVDPIDGTVDYAEGGQSWGSFIALIENGQPVLGVAHQPARNVTLTVEEGGECLLNNEPVHLRYIKPFAHAVIGTEVGWWCNASYFQDFLYPLSRQCQGVVSTLSACGSTIRLLEGRMGAYVNLGVPGKGAKLWDFAVGALAMKILGGYATDPYGQALKWDRIPMQAVLTTRKDIWEKLIALSKNWKF